MTPQEHARDLILRLSAIKPEGPDDIPNLLVWSLEKAVKEERERCAKIAETAPAECLHMWDRPGGAPGNGRRKTTGADIAALIRKV